MTINLLLTVSLYAILPFISIPNHYAQPDNPFAPQPTDNVSLVHNPDRKNWEVDYSIKCTATKAQRMINHAFQISNGDMDFIGTIASESMFDPDAVGDNGNSFWFCQINKRFNPEWQKEYRELKTPKEKMWKCYNMYRIWRDKGIIHKRLYWYNSRHKWIEKLNIVCK